MRKGALTLIGVILIGLVGIIVGYQLVSYRDVQDTNQILIREYTNKIVHYRHRNH